MKKNRIPRVSESELELLKFLWDQGPTSVRDLRALARRKKIIWAHTTILTLLRRLETKGCVAGICSEPQILGIDRAILTASNIAILSKSLSEFVEASTFTESE